MFAYGQTGSGKTYTMIGGMRRGGKPLLSRTSSAGSNSAAAEAAPDEPETGPDKAGAPNNSEASDKSEALGKLEAPDKQEAPNNLDSPDKSEAVDKSEALANSDAPNKWEEDEEEKEEAEGAEAKERRNEEGTRTSTAEVAVVAHKKGGARDDTPEVKASTQRKEESTRSSTAEGQNDLVLDEWDGVVPRAVKDIFELVRELLRGEEGLPNTAEAPACCEQTRPDCDQPYRSKPPLNNGGTLAKPRPPIVSSGTRLGWASTSRGTTGSSSSSSGLVSSDNVPKPAHPAAGMVSNPEQCLEHVPNPEKPGGEVPNPEPPFHNVLYPEQPLEDIPKNPERFSEDVPNPEQTLDDQVPNPEQPSGVATNSEQAAAASWSLGGASGNLRQALKCEEGARGVQGTSRCSDRTDAARGETAREGDEKGARGGARCSVECSYMQVSFCGVSSYMQVRCGVLREKRMP